MVDFTVAEYVKDASQLNKNLVIISLGHFNGEEPGMKYMVKYLKALFPQLPVSFIPYGGLYQNVEEENNDEYSLYR